MEEIWKGIKGYEDAYEVSNLGNVRRTDTKQPIKPVVSGNERYPVVGLWRNNKHKVRRVHRIVAETFIPNPENKPCIDHIDTNPWNNCVSNLRWCTHKENSCNPLSIEHNRAGQRKYNQEPGVKEKRRIQARETREKHQEVFNRVTDKLVAWGKSEEGRRKNSEAQKEYYKNPENIEKNRQAQLKYVREHPEEVALVAKKNAERMKDPKMREKIFLGSLHRARAVQCLETGEIFLSGGQADRTFGLWNGSANCSAIRGIGADKGRLHFVFVDKA